ncbi:MAG: DUF1178 family protein [Desulfarculus sp.]|jgi:hypothetical protein|nr:MAG: DUF1178 family protein [Desulfarculus sp.]
MIIFDLKCAQGHPFEGWFEDHKDLQSQLKRGLVACPVCGSEKVERVPSTFAIAKGARSQPDQEMAAKLLGRSVKRYFLENFDNVGPQFAKEALKMHYGASQPRNIRGVSTPEEEKMLKQEGIEFFKVGPMEAEDQAQEGGGEDDD